MKKKNTSRWSILVVLLLFLLLSACANNAANTGKPAESEVKVYNSLTLKITPGLELTHPIAVTEGALIRISAQGLTPEVRFRMYLGSPGTEYKDPAGTGKTDAEGKTSTIFTIPRQWDDGQPITQEELLLIAEWGNDGTVIDSVTVQIGYILEK
jgi:hypothetical protein